MPESPQHEDVSIGPDANRNQHGDVPHFPVQLLFRIIPSKYTYGNYPTISRLRQASMCR